ncbi:MAG: phosphotransferase [Acidobacteriota bacterium]|nr:phosphotransferase [Acidobacteriota bacterium]
MPSTLSTSPGVPAPACIWTDAAGAPPPVDGMTTARTRALPPGVCGLDPDRPDEVASYLSSRELLDPAEPCHVSSAGAGNMNLTLRVATGRRSLIVKQGRPWVEKYVHIEAPWERTLVEGAFYSAVAAVPAVGSRMPALLDLDEAHHILVLEDLGRKGDATSAYADGSLSGEECDALLDWLSHLSRVRVPAGSDLFANRAMRALNHEHIFRLPLAPDNGLDLNAITPGLSAAARPLASDAAYVAAVARLGERYLADGPHLVHGDYFPGSWVRTDAGLRIIDPEFCFCGAREFDYGVMLGHLALARTPDALGRGVVEAARRAGLDDALVLGFAGTEIMRRLMGVAQLPLPYGLHEKQLLLDLSRTLVLAPGTELTW